MTNPELKKSRRTLILVLASFILPVLIAKLALEQEWFNYGVTNQGKLLSEPKMIEEFGITKEQMANHWLVIYQLPNDCLASCLATLKGIGNAYILLGSDMKRVRPVIVSESAITNDILSVVDQHKWQIIENVNAINSDSSQDSVWIADPLGNVMLSFAETQNIDTMPSFGKALLADLKKLLKYSKIG